MSPLPVLSLIIIFFFFFTSTITTTYSSQPLTLDYYKQSCPKFEQIVQDTTINKQISSPTTAAAALRLFFHDCFVTGCDASILISSTPRNGAAERDADINLSLPGDAFDVVVRAKTALELTCPNTVSCSDILAVATRNLVVQTGGPYYNVLLGRKDALRSSAADVAGQLPRPNMTMDQIIGIFKSKGFSIRETVALSGAHTIGFSHCKEFSDILYHYSKTMQSDPSYYGEFAKALRNACSDYLENPALSVFNDVMTPNKFDNVYYGNVKKGLGLLKSDHALGSDYRTRGFVELYEKDQNVFFKDFASAMQKLSLVGVKTGKNNGEVRRRCDAFNY